jgi:hypothetical protein
MGKYYVASIKPFGRKCSIFEANSYDDAIVISKERKDKYKEDVIIVKKSEEGNDFIVEKYGYYKVYDFVNKILLGIATMLIFFISYLYYKYYLRK